MYDACNEPIINREKRIKLSLNVENESHLVIPCISLDEEGQKLVTPLNKLSKRLSKVKSLEISIDELEIDDIVELNEFLQDCSRLTSLTLYTNTLSKNFGLNVQESWEELTFDGKFVFNQRDLSRLIKGRLLELEFVDCRLNLEKVVYPGNILNALTLKNCDMKVGDYTNLLKMIGEGGRGLTWLDIRQHDVGLWPDEEFLQSLQLHPIQTLKIGGTLSQQGLYALGRACTFVERWWFDLDKWDGKYQSFLAAIARNVEELHAPQFSKGWLQDAEDFVALREVSLGYTGNFKDFERLACIAGLKVINFYGKGSKEGLQEFREKHPHLEINWNVKLQKRVKRESDTTAVASPVKAKKGKGKGK